MRLPVTNVYVDTKKLLSFTIVAFMGGGLLGSLLWNFGGVYVPSSGSYQGFGNMKQFTDLEELKSFIQMKGSNYYIDGRGFPLPNIIVRGFGLSPTSQAAKASEDAFSGTNVQVEGVDEADLVKTDGTYIYLAHGKSVSIIKAYPPEEAGITTVIDLEYEVHDIYIAPGKLVIFSYIPSNQEVLPVAERQKEKCQVTIYDLSDLNNPSVDRNLVLDGVYFSSRMIDDFLYFIVMNPAYLNDDEVILPTVREGKEWYRIEAEEIWYPNITQGYLSYNTVTSVNVKDPKAQITSETFLLDQGSVIYVSTSNLYIVSQGWRRDSAVTKIGIEKGGIVFKGNSTVPGYVLNQFSMDEYQGVFRVATTSFDWRTGEEGNNVYTLDEEMNIIGRLEGLAPGEKIYSARFMGPRCYLVTFKKVDPLFTIDLSDPSNPIVLGKLKIPGYSDYLHPYDENTLIGVGKETVEAAEGDFAWYQGLKISLFDVSDVENPKELAKIEIGDRGTDSAALQDHHAFLFSREKGLLVIPILEARIDENDFSGSIPSNFYGEYIYQGAYIFNIDGQNIELRGQITHIDDDSLLKSGFWFNSDLEVIRSLYIGDYLYTISQSRLKINSLQTLDELASINLGA